MRRARVFVRQDAYVEMKLEASRRFPDETGGMLLGYADPDDPLLLQITGQIGPGPNAVHVPSRFEPDSDWQDAQLAQAYETSGRTVRYLGDWHAHPRGSARLSRLDRRTARRIARTADARAPHPLMAILHGCPGAWRIAIYRRGWWRMRHSEVF